MNHLQLHEAKCTADRKTNLGWTETSLTAAHTVYTSLISFLSQN